MAAPSRHATQLSHLVDPPQPILVRGPLPRGARAGSAEDDDSLLRRRLPAPAYLLTPRALATPSAAVASLEARLSCCDREVESLLLDNQRLAATHVALSQELIAARHELHVASTAAERSRAEKDVEIASLVERSMHAEAEVRSVGQMKRDIDVVVSDVTKLMKARDELAGKVRAARDELENAVAEAKRTTAIKAEIETMRSEIRKGRAAIEFEKKVHTDNIQHSQQMESNMAAIARDIEKLRTDLINVEKRAATATAATSANSAGYAAVYGSSDITYGSNYANVYGLNQG